MELNNKYVLCIRKILLKYALQIHMKESKSMNTYDEYKHSCFYSLLYQRLYGINAV